MLVSNQLNAAIVEIKFEEKNVKDLQYSQEFRLDAEMFMQVISSDKKAFKTKLK